MASDEVENIAGIGIEEQGVDREVAAKCVLFGIGFEVDGRGMAAISVFHVTAEGGDFNVSVAIVDQDNTEMGTDLAGVRKEPQ